MSKALGLVSGGLDSSLAMLTLKRQGIDVTGIAFVTPFFNAERARQAAASIGHPLIIEDISQAHLEMLKNPRYGYGRNMNPCIDCHAMMFRLAGERMAAEGFDFLFSGEVLGQRPMSQNAQALRSVANLSGYPDQVLRPLSAKLLPPTPMENSGLVDREQLLDIQGRSRKRQQQYAEAWGYPDYPASAGGCLLTEKGFSNQLRDLLNHHPQATVMDVELLKVGRQFRLAADVKLVVGRNRSDNDALQQLAGEKYLRLRCRDFSGPLGVFQGPPDSPHLATAAAIVASYGKGQHEQQIAVLCFTASGPKTFSVTPLPREESKKLIIT